MTDEERQKHEEQQVADGMERMMPPLPRDLGQALNIAMSGKGFVKFSLKAVLKQLEALEREAVKRLREVGNDISDEAARNDDNRYRIMAAVLMRGLDIHARVKGNAGGIEMLAMILAQAYVEATSDKRNRKIIAPE